MFALYKLLLNIIFSYYIVTLLIMFFLGIGQKFVLVWLITNTIFQFYFSWHGTILFTSQTGQGHTQIGLNFCQLKGLLVAGLAVFAMPLLEPIPAFKETAKKTSAGTLQHLKKRTIEMQICANFQPTRTRSNTSNQQGRNECTSLSSMIGGNWTMKGWQIVLATFCR